MNQLTKCLMVGICLHIIHCNSPPCAGLFQQPLFIGEHQPRQEEPE
jgi:hypothetical protein